MEIKKIFSKYSLPEQFIYAGNDYLYIIKKHKKEFVQRGNKYDISLNLNNKNINDDDLSEIRSEMMSQPTGIVLNSSFFVFNILKFEKIPFNKKKLQEIVNWRITRIFPEDQNQYIHQYYVLNSEYILSILLKKEIKKSIDDFFFNIGVKQSYCGSSTIELINLLFNTSNPLKKILNSKKSPDFFIEIWGNSATIVFQKNFIPIYIRKFNFIDDGELILEIDKTIKYIKSSYSIDSNSFSLFQNNSPLDYESIKNKLKNMNLKNIAEQMELNEFINGVSL